MTVFSRHLDALAELMNVGTGRAAAALSEMLGVQARAQPPKVDYWRPGVALRALTTTLGGAFPQVSLRFRGPATGYGCLLLSPLLSRTVVARATGDPQPDPAIATATLEEVGNIVLNAAIGTLSNVVGTDLIYEVPRYYTRPADNPMFGGEEPAAFARTRLRLVLEGAFLPGELVLAVSSHVPALFLRALDLFFAEDRPERFLLPGDLVTAREPALWSTVLGSCVSVCLRHMDRPIAGMNHYMLDLAEGRPDVGRYGDSSISAIWERLARWDANPRHYRARIYGGAKMFPDQVFDIGARNIAMARAALGALGIPVVEAKVGGQTGVYVRFDTAADRVYHRVHGSDSAV